MTASTQNLGEPSRPEAELLDLRTSESPGEQPALHEPWRGLSSIAAKAAAYELEASYRESLADSQLILGSSIYKFHQQIATVSFRPDAFAARNLENAFPA